MLAAWSLYAYLNRIHPGLYGKTSTLDNPPYALGSSNQSASVRSYFGGEGAMNSVSPVILDKCEDLKSELTRYGLI